MWVQKFTGCFSLGSVQLSVVGFENPGSSFKLKPASDKRGEATATARGKLSMWRSMFLIRGYSWTWVVSAVSGHDCYLCEHLAVVIKAVVFCFIPPLLQLLLFLSMCMWLNDRKKKALFWRHSAHSDRGRFTAPRIHQNPNGTLENILATCSVTPLLLQPACSAFLLLLIYLLISPNRDDTKVHSWVSDGSFSAPCPAVSPHCHSVLMKDQLITHDTITTIVLLYMMLWKYKQWGS